MRLSRAAGCGDRLSEVPLAVLVCAVQHGVALQLFRHAGARSLEKHLKRLSLLGSCRDSKLSACFAKLG